MCRVAGRGEPGREPKGRVISGFKADFQPTRLIHPPFQVCKVNSFVLLINVLCNISNNNDYNYINNNSTTAATTTITTTTTSITYNNNNNSYNNKNQLLMILN